MPITNNDNIKEWDKNFQFVISKFTDQGDYYREHILNPALFSLLGEIQGKIILDAGCGQGYLSRLLAKKGAKVTGLEPTKGLIDYATKREKQENLGIKYVQADLSTWKVQKSNFDIVVSNMVFMDIPDWKHAMQNCIHAVKPGGHFIFSLSHPCFEYVQMDSPETKEFRHAKNWEDQPYVKVGEYFQEFTVRNFIGYSFHHMLSSYINCVIENGCTIKKLVEPQLPEELAMQNKHAERDFHVPSFLLVKAIRGAQF